MRTCVIETLHLQTSSLQAAHHFARRFPLTKKLSLQCIVLHDRCCVKYGHGTLEQGFVGLRKCQLMKVHKWVSTVMFLDDYRLKGIRRFVMLHDPVVMSSWIVLSL